MINIYSIDPSITEALLCYHDIFDGEPPEIKEEIYSLNMHKSISIICELINTLDYTVDIKASGVESSFPFETAFKAILLDADANSPIAFFSNPIVDKGKHIISLQMLLVLLKKVISYGNYTSLKQTDYTVSIDDYISVIKLQLVIVEMYSKEFENKTVDLDHFIYGNYHLNCDKNVANAFARSYYMFEVLSQSKSNFPEEIQKEYRDYYNDFSKKYNYTPTQYLSLLFREFLTCYQPQDKLICGSSWHRTEIIYGETALHEIGEHVINDLSQTPDYYRDWTVASDYKMWDFTLFNSHPFISDGQGAYISVSKQTLKNALFEKLYWKVRSCYPQTDSRSMAFYGRLFERYIQDLTQESVKAVESLSYISEFKYGKKKKNSSDAYIVKDGNLLIVESKGYSILQKTLAENNNMSKNNKKLFIDPILQADTRFNEINKLDKNCFADIATAYIVSVTMDNVNAVPTYLESIYSEILDAKKSIKVKYFFNLNIEEYEMLMFLVEKDIDFFYILQKYFESKLISPFSVFIHKHTKGEIELTKWLNQIYKDASATMMRMLKK